MGLVINTNVASLNAQRNLSESKAEQLKAFEKLSSGSRINKAADDAAGLAISENLKSQMRSTAQASRNTSDGISLIQTAEGGMNEIGNILIRLRELSVQASSDTIGDTERSFINVELNEMKSEIERIALSTKYNNTKLLSGEGGKLDIQVGTGNQIAEDRMSIDLSKTNVSGSALGVSGISFASKDGARDSIGRIDDAIKTVNANRAYLGAMQNRLQSTVSNLAVSGENLAASNSRVRDADLAVETSKAIKHSILEQAGTSVLAQANQASASALKLLG